MATVRPGLDLADGDSLRLARALCDADSAIERIRLAAKVDASGLHDSLLVDARCSARMTLHQFAHHVRQVSAHHPDDVQLLHEVAAGPRPEPQPAVWQRRAHARGQRRLRRGSALAETRGHLDRDDPDIQARLAGRAGERYDD